MMQPPNSEWRSWIYGIAWMTGAVVLTALGIWMISTIRWGWADATAPQRLAILGNALYMVLSGPLLVMFSLGMRNAIRNISGSFGRFNFSANSLSEGGDDDLADDASEKPRRDGGRPAGAGDIPGAILPPRR